MAAIFDPRDPSSPLAYDAPSTALLLLDFQGFAIDSCGEAGERAVATATAMREWARGQGIMVIHSIMDVHGAVPATIKGCLTLESRLTNIRQEGQSTAEHPDLAPAEATGVLFHQTREHLVVKSPGQVSAMASFHMQALLAAENVQSLIICGLTTSGAVIRTVLPAVDKGYVVTCVQDACGDCDSDIHDVLMTDILPRAAHVATAREFIAEWKSKEEASSSHPSRFSLSKGQLKRASDGAKQDGDVQRKPMAIELKMRSRRSNLGG
jgi:nicotinamidase-related amidase